MIELVIKIPEWKYKSICEGVEASKRCGVVGIDSDIHEAIYNGTPLPKGHGRLIDADKLELDDGYSNYDGYYHKYSQSQIYNAPTIIEAEGSESE